MGDGDVESGFNRDTDHDQDKKGAAGINSLINAALMQLWSLVR